MDRRSFIAGGAVLAPVVASPLAAAPIRGALRVLETRIANRDQFPAPLPAPGTRVALVRAHDRAYDPGSIAVHALDGARLGYLPPAQVGVLAAMMDAGFAAFGILTDRGVEVRLEQDTGQARWPDDVA